MEPPYLKVRFPEGQSGDWTLETFTVDERPESSGPYPGGAPEFARRRPGTYTRLKEGDTVYMTDLYDEWYTQKIAAEVGLKLGGEVLITGLGLGMIVDALLQPPQSPVEHITLLELSKDVMSLIAPHLEARYGERLTIHHADAYTWEPPPGAHYSVIWHDIWPNPQDPAALAEMERLEKRYAPYADWQGCWPREYVWLYEGKPWNREAGA